MASRSPDQPLLSCAFSRSGGVGFFQTICKSSRISNSVSGAIGIRMPSFTNSLRHLLHNKLDATWKATDMWRDQPLSLETIGNSAFPLEGNYGPVFPK